jgi:flagellar hook-length control protein FliK
MSLSISNNSVSSSVLPKSEGKASVSEGEAAETPGFWDKFKDALSTEKSESDQKVEGSVTKSKTGSESTDAMLEDAATQAKSSEETASGEEFSKVNTGEADKIAKAEKGQKADEATSVEGSGESVKKMTEEAALVGATQIHSEDKAAVIAEKTADQTVSENAELLSRLDESNKALKKPSEGEVAMAVGGATAGVIAAEQAQHSQPKPDVASTLSGENPEVVGNTDNVSNATLAAVATSTHSADGKLSSTPDGKTAPLVEGEGKPQANIAWSRSDGELAAKSEVKVGVAGTAIAAEKMAASTSTTLTGATTQAQASTQSALAASAQMPAQAAHVANQPAGDVAAAAAMMAGGAELTGKEAAKAGVPMGAQVAGANINGIKGSNKTPNPAGIGNDTTLQAAGAMTTTQQLRAEQQTPAAAAIQSSMVLTKENASDQVAERVQMMMSKNLKHVDIRLDPPELGRMQIRMSLNNDSATVHFTVQNQQTRDMVDQAMPRLREMLSQQGIQLADTSVQQQGQQQRHASHGSDAGGSGNGSSNGAGDVDSVDNGTSVEVAVKQNSDGISYYA